MLMQCSLNDVHISEVPKFLAESPNVTTHVIQLLDPSDVAHFLMILIWLSSVTSFLMLILWVLQDTRM